MVVGLIDLGINMCQIMGSIVANLVVNNVRNVAADSVKSKQIHAEYFRQVLLTDVNEIKEKLNSMAQSKILAAFDYIKRGLIVLQDLAPCQTTKLDTSDQLTEYYANEDKRKLQDLIKEASRFFHQADVWATEAFQDKANVTIPLRLEAIKIQLFCTMLLHWDKPHLWMEMWKVILTNMLKDSGIAQIVFSFNPWLSKNRKREIKSALVSVVQETVASLWKLAYQDVNTAQQAGELITYLKRPAFIEERYHEVWQKTVNLSNSQFFVWNQRLVIVVPECYRLCHLPNYRLCIIDRQFKVQIVDSVTLQMINMDSKNNPFRPDKDYGSVAYDQAKNLLLLIQFDHNELQTYEYLHKNDFSKTTCNITFIKSIELPEQGFSIFCTPLGHWIFRSSRGKIFTKWYGIGEWSKIADDYAIIFDAQDAKDTDGNQGIRLLSDHSIDAYFESKFYSTDEEGHKEVVSTICNENEDFNLISLFSTKEWCQNIMRFDCVNEDNVIVCQKLENDNQIRLSYVLRNASKETNTITLNTILPVQFNELVEQLVIYENVIYLATMGLLLGNTNIS